MTSDALGVVTAGRSLVFGDAKLGRGFYIYNSETGAATFGLTTFLYN